MGACSSSKTNDSARIIIETKNQTFGEMYGGFELLRVGSAGSLETKWAVVEVGNKVKASQLWSDSPVVIQVFRRFGCPLCRNTALKISSIGEILRNHGVRLVGVGLSETSVQGLIEGNYWRGHELYVDRERKLYKALNLPKGSVTLGLTNEFWESNRDRNVNGIKGEFAPHTLRHALQLGGTFVVSKGGETLLYEFRQQNFGQTPPLEDILTAVGIPTSELQYNDGNQFALNKA